MLMYCAIWFLAVLWIIDLLNCCTDMKQQDSVPLNTCARNKTFSCVCIQRKKSSNDCKKFGKCCKLVWVWISVTCLNILLEYIYYTSILEYTKYIRVHIFM